MIYHERHYKTTQHYELRFVQPRGKVCRRECRQNIFRKRHRQVYEKRGTFPLCGIGVQLFGIVGKGVCDLPVPAV